MLNVVGKLVKSGKETFDRLDSKINFSIPENLVMYLGINGRKDDRDLQVNKDNFRLQIGKMEKDKETIYTEEILLPAIEYVLKKTGKDQKAIIQLWPDLAKFLANEDKKKESNQILSFEEEKQRIVKLIKKHFKQQKQHIEIVNVSQQYPEIFNILKEHGKDGLSSLEKPILDKESFSALSLAKYLYRLSQNNKKFRELLYNTKTQLQKKNDKNPIGENQSDYYSLVEVSIRLYEILSGVYIQGGIDRQSKYDKIIGGILQRKDIDIFKVKDYPELKELHQFCNQIQENILFDRLYINTKGVRQVTEKKQVLSKTRNALLLTLGLGIGYIATNEVNKYIQLQKQKAATEETIKEIFENKKATWSADYMAGEYVGEKKMEAIQRYQKNIFDRFLLRYGTIGDFSKDAFSAKIYDCLNNQKLLTMLGSAYHANDDGNAQDIIIDEYLIPQNIGEFKMHHISVTPYENLLPYIDEFINTLFLPSELEVTNDTSSVKNIGEFMPKYGYLVGPSYAYNIAVAYDAKLNKSYVVAGGGHIIGEPIPNTYTLSTVWAKDFAIDVLRQTKPVINKLLDLYLYRYYGWADTDRGYVDESVYKTPLPLDIQVKLIKDFVAQGLLNKIDKKDDSKLLSYLDDFAIKNKSSEYLLPNGFLEKYEQAMDNTIKNESEVLEEYGRFPASHYGKGVVIPLGVYRTSDGKIFRVGAFSRGGKSYLYANSDDIDSSGGSYGPYEGAIVARDYFQTKAKFVEQKILREKQQKSASQKHVDKPRDLLKNDLSTGNYKAPQIPLQQ